MDFQRSIALNEMICFPVFVLKCGFLLGCMSTNVAMYFTGIMEKVSKYIKWKSLVKAQCFGGFCSFEHKWYNDSNKRERSFYSSFLQNRTKRQILISCLHSNEHPQSYFQKIRQQSQTIAVLSFLRLHSAVFVRISFAYPHADRF